MVPTSSLRLAASLVLALGAAPALAQPAPGERPMQGMPGHQGMMPGQGSMPGSPGSQAMMESMQTMQRDMMGQPMTGDADHDFAAMMREHHRGAVAMARAEIQYGRDPELKKMARKIVEDQEKEIRQLDKWLDRHPSRHLQR